METAIFAGGCFWCLHAIFSQLDGVRAVHSGYCGGALPQPNYQQVCGGQSGHAEAVRIEFDPQQLGYATLLEVFFASHDPTTLNRQGHDSGTQYRSEIFYLNTEQQRAAEQLIQQLEHQQVFNAPIVTAVSQATEFYPAESEHQDYFFNHRQAPYCQAVIEPKLTTFLQHYAHRVKR